MVYVIKIIVLYAIKDTNMPKISPNEIKQACNDSVEENIVFLVNLGFVNNYGLGRDSWTGCGIVISSEMIEYTSHDLFKKTIKEQIIKRIDNLT